MRFLEVLKRRFCLFRVRGIPVSADYRWLFVLVLMSVVTAGSLASLMPNSPEAYLVGFFTTLFFFASVLVHELAHAVAARLEGVDVLEIILHPFGGLARLRHEPETPRAEFRIAAAGPAASFGLALAFLALMTAANAGGALILAYSLLLLASFNFLIGVFNLFPGYPLDGGRLLRAYLWRSGRDLDEATLLTGRCGQIIGAALIAFGLLIAIVRADFFTGFWMLLIGLFLYDAAAGIIKDIKRQSHVSVMDVMTLPPEVPPDVDLLHFVDHILPVHRRTVFPVAAEKQFYGLLLLEDMKAVERDAWRTTRVSEVMRPVSADHFVETGASLAYARELMSRNGTGAVGVLDTSGRLVGFIGGGVMRKRASREN